ncbi:DUF6273 domain-containing protein [uncultured Dysosmobacter sp.]|uniref:DUF6273 domain-containing protein n=1 Tax=uncultured Dysosmobacter sp. TaxID=2591384 RepID=UPI002612E4F8|nr:DUF6273 domain-containing protein [uncultured Dysosmobacter sp.]
MERTERLKLPIFDSNDFIKHEDFNAASRSLENNLLKDTTAALYGLGTDAVPDEVLAALSKAALLKTVGHEPVYQEVTMDISSLAVGDTARIPVGDSVIEYWIAAKDYEPELNGTGRTLLVAKSGINGGAYNSETADSTYYLGSKPDVYLEETYKPQIRADVREAIGTTTIKVKKYSSDEIFNILRGVFILSASEYGYKSLGDGIALSIASTVMPSNDCWTRTPGSTYPQVYYVSQSGNGATNCANSESIAPAFTLPNDFTYTIYADEGGNYFPEQAYTPIHQVLTDVLGNGAGTPKIEIGSYWGTGTFGADHPNILTFDRNVSLLAVYTADRGLQPSSGGFRDGVIWLPSVKETQVYVDSSGSNIRFSQDGNSIAWHSTVAASSSAGPGYQLNVSGQQYFYFAITQ